MTDSRILPGARARLVDNTGVTTREFYDFFRRLQESGTPDAQLEELARKLGSPDGSVAGIPPLPTDYVRSIVEGQGIRITGGDGVFTVSTRYAGGVVVEGPTSDEAFSSIDNVLVDNASTGVRVGGYGSVVGGIGVGTTVNVTAGVGSILSLDDRENPVFTEVSWGSFTGVAVANTSVPLTWWYIDTAGALQQQTTKPTDSEYRDRIYLFRTGFTGGVISSLVSIVNPLQNTAANLGDLARAISTMIINGGGRVSANGANLKLTRNSGQLLSWGANYATNAKDPHEVQLPLASPLSFRMILSTGNPASAVTDLPVGFYESGGVVTAVPGASSRACIFTVYQLPSGNVVIQYDNTFYTSIAEARVALSTGARNYTANPAISAANGITSGFIIATKGATDLSDSTQAVFFVTNKFGEFGGGAAAGAVARWGGITGNIPDQADLFTTFQPLDTQLTSLAALSYTGNAGKVIAVNGAENAFELVTGGGGGSAVNVQDEGSTVVTGATAINFVGAGVTATNAGSGVATVTIPGGGGGSSLTRATLIGGQTEPAIVFLDDTGLRTSAEGFGSAERTARCALARGLSGKWYFECLLTARGASGVNTPAIGVCQSAHANAEMGAPGTVSSGGASWAMYSNGSGKYHNGNLESYGSSWTNGDVIMVAVNMDNGRIWWGRNGTWFNSGNPATGANPAYTNLISSPWMLRPGISHGSNSDCTLRLTSASFSYSPPSGYSAWA